MDAHGSHPQVGHVMRRRVLFRVLAALLVLTYVTVAVTSFDFGRFNLWMAMGIAVVKASLVVLFFMHVKESSRLTKLIIGTGFFFLLVLFALTLTDYLSRGWSTMPSTAASAPAPETH